MLSRAPTGFNRAAEKAPPHLWFGLSAVFHYLGPSFAVLLFPAVGVLGVAWFRIASAAAAFALVTKPWRTIARADGRTRLLLAGLGLCLAAMNTSFYLALDLLTVMTTGALLNIVTIAIALAGISIPHFTAALVLLGVGWNFLYIGGTTLLTETYRPEEKAKEQGANDQCIFIVMLVSSFSAGLTVTSVGWSLVNLLALPMILVVGGAIVWSMFHQRAEQRPAAP